MMKSEKDQRNVNQIAADWVARLDRAPLTDTETQSLNEWLAASSRHFGAFARANTVFVHTERARALGAGFDVAAFEQIAPPAVPVVRRRLVLSGAAAAAVLIGVGVGSYAYLKPIRYQSRRGEVRSIPMDDGSVITLNTASTVEVSYTPLNRMVQLVDGEALFDVAKDPGRPFIITAGDTKVRAVGTSFAVRHIANEPMEVLVREGIVDVTRSGGTQPLRVPANSRAVAVDTPGVPAKAVAVALDAASVARELSWRDGMIAFEGISLGQAAKEFRRYSDTHIIINDPQIAAISITGLFFANNPSGFAHAVATNFGLQVGMTPAGQIMLWK